MCVISVTARNSNGLTHFSAREAFGKTFLKFRECLNFTGNESIIFIKSYISIYCLILVLASFCISLTIDSIDSTEKSEYSAFLFSLQEKRNNVVHRTALFNDVRIVFISIKFKIHASTFFQERWDLQNATKEKRISLVSPAMNNLFFVFSLLFSPKQKTFSRFWLDLGFNCP